MRRPYRLLAGFAALVLALSPGLAEARAGSGSSMGSRGSQTYTPPPATHTAPYSAAPMQRSMTPQSQPAPSFANPGYQSGRSSGFMSGLFGGLIGVGLGSMLFGGGHFFGGGLGFGGIIGLVLQIVLVVWLGRWLFRLLFRQSPAMATGPNMFMGSGSPPGGGPGGGGGMGGGGSAPPPIAIAPEDYQQFEQLLTGVQAAWTAQDLNGLRAMTTPEMASYFADQLSDQVSRGVRNQVSDVRLVSGDLAQAWTEQGRDYATVAMRFSMIDVTRDTAGRVVDGSPNEHVTATEIWTFVRSRGGHWILSAIQQAR
jgi:predicted lipid-binding transport protein (Tim44 family)